MVVVIVSFILSEGRGVMNQITAKAAGKAGQEFAGDHPLSLKEADNASVKKPDGK